MDTTNPKTTEELIIAHLANTGATGEELLGIARTKKKSFTKQALYHILRALIKREVIVKHGKQFSLSQLWIKKMSTFFALAEKQYGVVGESNDFLSLSDGDKVTYAFKSPVEADRFWAHAFTVLGELLAKKEPLYIYNPHEWFLLARTESEAFLFNELKERGQKVWLICGGNTALDAYTKKHFDGTILQYYMSTDELFEARNYYLNIFGDYIIEAHINETVAQKVDDFYNTNTKVTESMTQILTTLLEEGRTTITITRNKKKAEKLKKLFTPYFF